MTKQGYRIEKQDNLDFVRSIDSGSVDLIYSDILFATGRDFEDYKDLKWDKTEVYNFYKPRVKEMYRVLKESGTLALQMDYRISHWLRDICDDEFGYKNCVNVVEWVYASGGSSKSRLSQKNDTIIIYAKNTNMQKFNPQTEKSYNRDYKPYRFKGVEEFQDEYGLWYTNVAMRCIWNMPMVGRTSSERNGYATQKPLKLMNRIRDLYTDKGDVILDLFMGSGSMAESAIIEDRLFLGCDISEKAIDITNQRIEKLNASIY